MASMETALPASREDGDLVPRASTVTELEDRIRALVMQRNDLRERMRSAAGWGRGRGPPLDDTKGIGKSFTRRGTADGGEAASLNAAVAGAGAAIAGGDVPATTTPRNLKRPLEQMQKPLPLNIQELIIEKRPKLEQDSSTVKRHRNLFGSLMGHLKKAKETLEKERETKQSELHRQHTEKVDLKILEERQSLADLRRQEMRARQQENIDRVRTVQREIIVKEFELLRTKLENHYNRMTHFIRTRAEPPLFWLPSAHTRRTNQLQAETRHQIEHKVKTLYVQFSDEFIAAASVAAHPSAEERLQQRRQSYTSHSCDNNTMDVETEHQDEVEDEHVCSHETGGVLEGNAEKAGDDREKVRSREKENDDNGRESEPNNDTNKKPNLRPEDIDAMTVRDLKNELKERELSCRGLKPQLQERLREHCRQV